MNTTTAVMKLRAASKFVGYLSSEEGKALARGVYLAAGGTREGFERVWPGLRLDLFDAVLEICGPELNAGLMACPDKAIDHAGSTAAKIGPATN